MQSLVLCPKCGADNRVDGSRASESTPVCGKCQEELNPQAPGHPIVATDASFDRDVLQSGLPTVVDFWADWCGPCKAFAPTLDAFARDMAGQVRVVKVNVDSSPQVARRYGIQSIPTLVVFKGQEAGRMSGALPLEQLKTFVGRYV